MGAPTIAYVSFPLFSPVFVAFRFYDVENQRFARRFLAAMVSSTRLFIRIFFTFGFFPFIIRKLLNRIFTKASISSPFTFSAYFSLFSGKKKNKKKIYRPWIQQPSDAGRPKKTTIAILPSLVLGLVSAKQKIHISPFWLIMK